MRDCAKAWTRSNLSAGSEQRSGNRDQILCDLCAPPNSTQRTQRLSGLPHPQPLSSRKRVARKGRVWAEPAPRIGRSAPLIRTIPLPPSEEAAHAQSTWRPSARTFPLSPDRNSAVAAQTGKGGTNGRTPGQSRPLRRARTHGRGSRALLAALHLKLDVFSLFQAVEVELLKTAAMEEYLLSVSGTNKAKSSVANNALDCPLHSKPRCA